MAETIGALIASYNTAAITAPPIVGAGNITGTDDVTAGPAGRGPLAGGSYQTFNQPAALGIEFEGGANGQLTAGVLLVLVLGLAGFWYWTRTIQK